MTPESTPILTGPASPEASAEGASAYVPAMKHLVLRVLRGRWRAIIVCIAVTFALSVLVALLFTKRTWEATATLLYTPLPVPQDFQAIYEPPELSSVQSLALSRPLLEEVKREFDLPIPVKTMRKLIRVQTAPGSDNLLEISFGWGNPEESAAMTNRLAEAFRKEAARVRTQALGIYYADLQNHLKECKRRLLAARKRLRDYSKQHNVVDADSDLDVVQDAIRSLEEAMGKTRREDVELAAQAKKISSHITDLKKEEEKKAKEARQYEAAHESVADARRRQDRLRELIGEERRVTEVKAQLEAKRREYERAAVLVEKKLIPRTRFERIQGEMETLMARIKENKSILDWKSELRRIDKAVVPHGKAKSLGSPIIAQVLFRKLELDLQILGGQKEMFELQKSLTAKRALREELIQRRHEFQALEDDVETIDDERRAVEDRLAVFRSLRSLGPVEFSIVSPAKPAKYAAKSNRKIVFVAAFGLGAMLSAALLFGLEIYKNGLMTIEDRLSLLGLAQLGQMPPDAWDKPNAPGGRMLPCQKAVRQLALKIRQAVARPGAIILFSNLDGGGRSPALLAELAWCLSRRDERVLIWAANEGPKNQEAFGALIDPDGAATWHELPATENAKPEAAHGAEKTALQKGPLGLAEYLSFVCVDLHEFVTPTMIPGVDCLLSGHSVMPAEGIATHRMRELLAELRNKYSIILADGPSVSREDDLELLAPYSDGIVFLARDARRFSPRADEVLRDLYKLRAPIVGAMVS